MSGFNSVVSAMMMSPSIQAAMNPFLMSGNGNAFLSQLLTQGQGFPNWPGMPQLPSKMLNQLWAMNNVSKVRIFVYHVPLTCVGLRETRTGVFFKSSPREAESKQQSLRRRQVHLI